MVSNGLPETILSILKIAPLVMQQAFPKLMCRQLSCSRATYTVRLPIAAAPLVAKLDAFG
jgi:hypothetical protein